VTKTLNVITFGQVMAVPDCRLFADVVKITQRF